MSMENHPSARGLPEGNSGPGRKQPPGTPNPRKSSRWDNSRPATAPDFLLSRAHGSIRTQGVIEQISDPWLAAEELRAGIHQMVVGALPFDLDQPAALSVPRDVIRSDYPLEPPAHYRWSQEKFSARIAAYDPAPADHQARVEAAISTIAHSGLDKVVLARAVELEIDPPVDPLLIASRLIDGSPNHDGFVVDLSPAGDNYLGKLLVGSSPEMLIRRRGEFVEAFPLAGSLPRSRDKHADAENARRLADSMKNQAEHAYVVDDLAHNLAPLCTSLEVPEYPELVSTSEMWHLATRIRGRLKDPSLSALDLALVVHPTPAICGTPTESAFGVIKAVESDRGFYAGAVGWCDSDGDGEFVVAIRCAEINTAGNVARLWAGGGIVAHSDPEEELAETFAKMSTVLRAFGVRT